MATPTPPRAMNESCAPRASTPDPGPTKAYAEEVFPMHAGETVPAKDECLRHQDCNARKYGRCVARADQTNDVRGRTFLVPAHNECIYDECLSDQECQNQSGRESRSDLVCSCNGRERNVCSFANCRTDADCPSPFPCGARHYCHAGADECRKNSDCKSGNECTYSWEVKHYACAPPPPVYPG